MRDIASFLPSKRLLLTASALFIALGLALGASYAGGHKQEKNSGSLFATSAKNVGITEEVEKQTDTDTDRDNLKDWEEALWGTDPKNPDSDDDKTRDGDEVRAGRNPSVASPNDLLPPEIAGIPVAGTSGETPPLDSSKTALLARELYATVLSLKNGGRADSKTIAEKSETLADTFTAGTSQEPAYRFEQLATSGDNSPEGLQRYGNAVGEVIVRYASQIKEGELTILARAMESGDKKDIEKLAPLVGIYGSASKDMVAITVPSEAIEAHLGLVNGYAGIAQALVYMGQTLDDPLTGMAGLSQSQYYGDMIDTATRNLQTFFLTNRVMFGPKEKGSIFTSGQ